MDELTFRQLLPQPGEVTARAMLAAASAECSGPPPVRPHTLVNFVASADGRVTIEGRSGKLGDDGDKELFRALREHADAVFAGTNTMATERYGRILVQPERRSRRVAQGLHPEPLACLISRSGQLPLEIPLFAEPEARVIVFAPRRPDLDGVRAQVDYEPLPPGQPALTAAFTALRARHGVRTLLCEGGPTTFAALLAEGLADELYLSVAPKLAGPAGAGSIIGGGPPLDGVIELRLLTALERDSSLYLRYGIGR